MNTNHYQSYLWNNLETLFLTSVVLILLQVSGLDSSSTPKIDQETEVKENSEIFDEEIPKDCDDSNQSSSLTDPHKSTEDADPKSSAVNPDFSAPNPGEIHSIKQEVDDSEDKTVDKSSPTKPVKTSFTSTASENLVKKFVYIQSTENVTCPEFRKPDVTGSEHLKPDDSSFSNKVKKKLESHVLQSKRLISKAGVMDVFIDEALDKKV